MSEKGTKYTLAKKTKHQESGQGIILTSLLIAISFENLLWMTIICLFPIHINKHHPTISTFHTGLILSIFHFSTLIITPIIGQHLHYIGRKNALVLSYFSATLAALGYCGLSFIESTQLFYLGSVLIRLMEGITTSLNATSVYALAPMEFPEQKEKIIGYLEMSAGLGLTIGPFLSGIVYSYLHYAGTFFFFAIILFITGCFLQLALPKRMNKSQNEDEEEEDQDSTSTKVSDDDDSEKKGAKEKEISYKIFFDNHESIFILTACSLCMITLYHYETILSVRLTTQMGLTEEHLGFFFCAQSITYAIFSYVSSQISNSETNGLLITVGFLLTFTGNLLLGPSQYLYLPQEVWIMALGLAILGVSGPLIYIPILPELISIMNRRNKYIKDDPKLMDMCSGIYNTAINLGFWLTPILSGTLADFKGYQFTCDCMAMVSLIFGVIFFIVIVSQKKKLLQQKKMTKRMKKDLEQPEIIIDDI